MGEIKQINTKNRTYYFYNDRIDLKGFDAKLLKSDKKRFWWKAVKSWQKRLQDIGVYCIGFVTVKKINNCNNINSVNPLYLMIDEMIDHFEEKKENKYLVLDDVDEN